MTKLQYFSKIFWVNNSTKSVVNEDQSFSLFFGKQYRKTGSVDDVAEHCLTYPDEIVLVVCGTSTMETSFKSSVLKDFGNLFPLCVVFCGDPTKTKKLKQ